MGKRYNKLGINLLILSTAIAFSLYITYLLGNYHDYSLKADNNPSIRADDAARESASYGRDMDAAGITSAISPAEESEPGDIHEGQDIESDNDDIDNAGADIKDIDTKEIETAKEIQLGTETKTTVKKPKQGEIESESGKLQAMGIAGGGIITSDSSDRTITSGSGDGTTISGSGGGIITSDSGDGITTSDSSDGTTTFGSGNETTTSGNKQQNDVNSDGTLNKYVLDIIKTYKIGDYPYLLNNDYQNYNGVTENLYYDGELLLKADPNGNRASYCTGITFEVFFKAMQNRNRDLGIDINNFNGMNKEELYDFALTWYVAKGPKDISNMALAMEKYGVGKRIHNMEELRSGDFIDFSRENDTGHSAVFINWIRAKDTIIGFKYWSSQGSTNGISYKEEYFNIKSKDGNKYGNVIADKFYMGRIDPVSEYKGFK